MGEVWSRLGARGCRVWGAEVCRVAVRSGLRRIGSWSDAWPPASLYPSVTPSASRVSPGRRLSSPLRERRRAARAREGWPGPRRGRASVRRERRRSFSRLSSSVSLARGCPLRRRPAGRRGVRPPMRALPGGREACGKARESAPAPRHPCVPRCPGFVGPRVRASERGVVGACQVGGGYGPPLLSPSHPVPFRSAAARRPSNNGFCRLVFPERRRCRGSEEESLASLSPCCCWCGKQFPSFLARSLSSSPLDSATSDQTWRPAEFKHISQRRKRN